MADMIKESKGSDQAAIQRRISELLVTYLQTFSHSLDPATYL
jgi:hypothetical protein